MGMSNWVHVSVDLIKKETDAAFLVVIDGDEHWIPKSQMSDPSDYSEDDEDVTISITQFIAKEKGLEGD